ncbi:MAG: MarR family winged helix-turn-helix transcriptional regulator [Christensenellaceae bacterium]|jgi:DNA-binding MarR family transcriptional regulator|nr:MarR family winged helix-turn-helix transcriptional regulator [Christensenellaceae bacterium]
MEQSGNIGIAIKTLANLLRQHGHVGMACGETHSTGMQGWILSYVYLHREEDVFQRDIEARFHIRRSTVTGILHRMENNGLIERVSVPQDARLKKLVLTPKALEVQLRICGRLDAIEARLTQGLSAAETRAFLQTAEKMRRNLENDPVSL